LNPQKKRNEFLIILKIEIIKIFDMQIKFFKKQSLEIHQDPYFKSYPTIDLMPRYIGIEVGDSAYTEFRMKDGEFHLTNE